MIINKRQALFDSVTPPTLKRIENPDISGFDGIFHSMVRALRKKYTDESFIHFEDCVKQTVSFLKSSGATPKQFWTIKLWSKFVKMPPKLEAINISLGSMLINHHYPKMAKAMSEGQIYSHYHLTLIKEAVLYTMEFFVKEGLIE